MAAKAGAQEATKAGAQLADDVVGGAAKGSIQATDYVAQAGAKASANAGKVAGKVIIGISAVFLVWDLFDLGFTIRDLLEKKGWDAALKGFESKGRRT